MDEHQTSEAPTGHPSPPPSNDRTAPRRDPPAAPLTPGIQVRAVDFILYPVSSLSEAAAFYRDVLGLKQELYSEQWQWAEFNCGNLTLSLKGGEPRSTSPSSPRLALAVPDVRAACEHVRSRGVRVLSEPVDYGVCCSVEILDPDGNVVILHRRADGSCG